MANFGSPAHTSAMGNAAGMMMVPVLFQRARAHLYSDDLAASGTFSKMNHSVRIRQIIYAKC